MEYEDVDDEQIVACIDAPPTDFLYPRRVRKEVSDEIIPLVANELLAEETETLEYETDSLVEEVE